VGRRERNTGKTALRTFFAYITGNKKDRLNNQERFFFLTL
jgi:hypothetical protein